MSGTELQCGDLVWVDFDPAFGHEQQGRRPALVVSNAAYNKRSSVTIVCPITGSKRTWPFHVGLPRETSIEGAIIVDQIKAIDSRRIVSTAVSRIDEATMNQVRRMLRAIVSDDIGPQTF